MPLRDRNRFLAACETIEKHEAANNAVAQDGLLRNTRTGEEMSDKQNRITPEGDILAPCELYEKATHIEIDGRLEKLSGSTGTMFWIGEGAGQLCLSDLKVASWNWIIRKYRFMKVVGMRPLRFYGLKVGDILISPMGSELVVMQVAKKRAHPLGKAMVTKKAIVRGGSVVDAKNFYNWSKKGG